MKVNHERLARLVSHICSAAGTEPALSDQVAAHLVEANLKGHDSHGVGMLPAYIHNIRAGHLKPNQHATIVRSTGPTLVVDGGFGYGQVVGPEAMRLGIEQAKDTGIAVVALKNAHHLGRIGGHAELVAQAGFISMHYVNVVGHPPQVAPFGGIEKRLSTNPYCCAIPVQGDHPVVLDMATSAIAAGKVRVARNSGNLVPEACLIDKDGKETRDPNEAAAQLHFGKHKGFGLALVCEMLAGALTGAWSIQPGNPREGTIVNHMLTIILDPAVIGDTDQFTSELKALIAYVKDTAPAPGGTGVMIPGEPERIADAERRHLGIDIDDTSWNQILATAASVGMDAARTDRILQGNSMA
ncbi:MAG: malate/lactate/ureidoglycolate dehydrogenase [Pseudomonadales bacterium]